MATAQSSWTLTDVEADRWLDRFAINAADLKLPGPHSWSIRKTTLHGGLRDGVDLVELDNGALAIWIVPTRGMSIWRGAYHGMALSWQAPVHGPVHPRFVHPTERGGLGWLGGFDEWIVRCGLNFNGPPGDDVVVDEAGRESRTPLTLHGRIANLPAELVEVQVSPEPPFELAVVGRVEEAMLFWPHLSLTTRISTVPGSNGFTIEDEITNRGGQPAELELLYHCNFGPPLLGQGAEFIAPVRSITPRDSRAAEGIDTCHTYPGPTPGFAEQVYFFDLAPAADSDETITMLRGPDGTRAAVLRYGTAGLPQFTLWKNPAALEDGYVTGLEPGTNRPNFRTVERRRGRVLVLPPGGSHRCRLRVEVLDRAEDVDQMQRTIDAIQGDVPPVVQRSPAD